MATLETMPGWAQDIVVDQALGLLEHDDKITWTEIDRGIIRIKLSDLNNVFRYTVFKEMGTIV